MPCGQNEATGKLLRFPRMPRPYISSLVHDCPALGVIAARLDDLPDGLRPVGECVLAELFAHMLHLPRVTEEEAEIILGHDADPSRVADEELGLLENDPDRRPIHDAWCWMWEREDDDAVRLWARYSAALLARLYRLEFRALNERAALATA